MGRRDLAARVLGSRPAEAAWRSFAGSPRLMILAYHRVLDIDERLFPFDEDVISASPSEFRAQMEFVRRNFDVLSFADLERFESGEEPWPKRPLIVTFDDGYRDNYTNAFPILKEFGLPATIFLTTGHIGSDQLFWWDEVAYCFKQTGKRSVSFRGVFTKRFNLSSAGRRRRAIQRVLEWAKEVDDDVRCRFIHRLHQVLEVDSLAGLGAGMHLSWDDVRSMASSGIEIGSHTVTHPILSRVSEEKLDRELTESKATIEHELGTRVLSVAYPAGRSSRFNEKVRSAVKNAGFRYGVSYEEGVMDPYRLDRFAMPRLHVERYHSASTFRATLMVPRVMLWRARSPAATGSTTVKIAAAAASTPKTIE